MHWRRALRNCMKVQLVRPRSVIGKNTVESLQSGIIYGFAAQVDGITERIIAELGTPATVIATGGLATVVLEECRLIDIHEPWLTLIGLAVDVRTKYRMRSPDRPIAFRP